MMEIIIGMFPTRDAKVQQVTLSPSPPFGTSSSCTEAMWGHLHSAVSWSPPRWADLQNSFFPTGRCLIEDIFTLARTLAGQRPFLKLPGLEQVSGVHPRWTAT